jgi:flagellar basal-body rod protein FlgG
MSIMSAVHNAAGGVMVSEKMMEIVSSGFSRLQSHGAKLEWAEVGHLGSHTIQTPGSITEGNARGVGVQIGTGVTVKAVHKDMSQGSLQESDSPLHMAIQGNGFFQYIRPDGRIVYSRKGICRADKDGVIVNSDGFVLAPGISAPSNHERIMVSQDGVVSAKMPGVAEPTVLGQIELARFIEPRCLATEGDYFTATTTSGDPIVGKPEDEAFGSLKSNYLEVANGSAVKLMGDMIAAQRNHSQCLAIIKKCDEMSAAQAST